MRSGGTITAAAPAEQAGSGALVRSLGLLDATMIVVGSMVGSGIFIVSADIARQVRSPGLLLVVWLVTGVLTVIGALCYGELAAAMPAAGGQYVYLREAFGPLWGFLYGWTTLLVIQTATIAAVAIAFAKFTGVLIPWFSSSTWLWQIGRFGPYRLWFGELGPYTVGPNTQNLLAILSIIVLTWVNLRGIRTGALVQNVLTLTKTGALVGVIVLGVAFATETALTANFGRFWEPAQPGTGAGGTDWVGLLTVIGVAMVGSLFAADAWNNVTFVAGEVKDPERTLPRALALLVQGAWASVLCLSGTYGQLLDFLIFSVLLFYILTIGGIFVLRWTRPGMARPYRTWGYPVLPAVYIAVALFIEVQLLRYKPQYTWPGLLLVLLGMPVYWVWKKVREEG